MSADAVRIPLHLHWVVHEHCDSLKATAPAARLSTSTHAPWAASGWGLSEGLLCVRMRNERIAWVGSHIEHAKLILSDCGRQPLSADQCGFQAHLGMGTEAFAIKRMDAIHAHEVARMLLRELRDDRPATRGDAPEAADGPRQASALPVASPVVSALLGALCVKRESYHGPSIRSTARTARQKKRHPRPGHCTQSPHHACLPNLMERKEHQPR